MDLCAVIVTYHPNLVELEHNVEALRKQLKNVLLVDNGSGSNLVQGLRALAAKLGCDLIENPVNLGIAEALNQGVRFAQNHGAEFVLFFDQDSTIRPGFVIREIAAYREQSQHNRVGLVSPAIISRPDGSHHTPVRARDGRFMLAQTSGALMPLAVFEDAGLFDAALFIDCVDYEHCLRMARRGWQIAYAPMAELDHMPGNATPVRFLGRTILTVNASPIRHYYETRNCLWVVLRYVRFFPQVVVRFMLHMVKVRIRALILEPNRPAKLRASLLGLVDGLRNRMGPRTL